MTIGTRLRKRGAFSYPNHRNDAANTEQSIDTYSNDEIEEFEEVLEGSDESSDGDVGFKNTTYNDYSYELMPINILVEDPHWFN